MIFSCYLRIKIPLFSITLKYSFINMKIHTNIMRYFSRSKKYVTNNAKFCNIISHFNTIILNLKSISLYQYEILFSLLEIIFVSNQIYFIELTGVRLTHWAQEMKRQRRFLIQHKRWDLLGVLFFSPNNGMTDMLLHLIPAMKHHRIYSIRKKGWNVHWAHCMRRTRHFIIHHTQWSDTYFHI